MCTTTLAALLGLATGCAGGAPATLLAPADPGIETRWHPPPSPLAGLKPYRPVEARADRGSAPARDGGEPGGMGAMPGMGMPGETMRGKTMPGKTMDGMTTGGMTTGGKR